MSTRCIICYTDLPQWSLKKPPDIFTSSLSSDEEPGMKLPGQVQQKDLLSKHLDVIFILRNIFEVPLNQLSFYLRHCPSIENWITTCAKCDQLVQDYGVIYRKGQEARRRLIKIVRETYDKDRDDIGMVALDITDRCRHFISENNYQVISNPFTEGDSRARDLLKSKVRNQDNFDDTIEVKEEFPDVFHLPENNFEHLNESLFVAGITVNSPSSLNPYYDDNDDNDHWNEELSQQSEKEPIPLTTEVPLHLPIIPSESIRKNISRMAKNIAKSKTHNLLRKPDKSLIPPKPKRVKLPKKPKKIKYKTFQSGTKSHPKIYLTPAKLKRKKGRPRKQHVRKVPVRMPEPEPGVESERKRGRPRKYFYIEEPVVSVLEPEPGVKSERKRGRPRKYFYIEEPVVSVLEPEPEIESISELEQVDEEERTPEPPPPSSPKVIYKDDLEELNDDFPVNLNEGNDDDFEISDIDDSSDFEISDEEKFKRRKKRKSKPNNWKLKCPEADCSEEFDRRPQLNAHLLEIHKTSPKPPVIHPTRKYPDECYTFSENRKRQFQIKIPSKCELCLKTFSSQGSLRGHMRIMDELRWPHHCKICGKGDTSKASLDKHEALCKTGEALLNLITCPAEGCGLILNSTVLLETHYRHHHRDLETQPCAIANCSEKFFTETGLEIHLKDKHKEDKPFNCDHCSQGFTSKRKVEEHMKRVVAREAVEKDPSRASICNYCGKTFVTAAGLRYHVNRAHENNFSYTCEHCGKGHGTQDSLNIHLWKLHERRDVPLKWRCDLEGCGRICSSRIRLEAHKARHAGIPQFCCEECGKEFYDEQHLKEHVMAMHESKKGEKVKCEICGMEFGYWKYMIRHRKTVHENKKRRPKNKPKTESSEMKEERNAGVGPTETMLMAAGQQFNLQIL